jgi:hypothetical protein
MHRSGSGHPDVQGSTATFEDAGGADAVSYQAIGEG